EVGKVIERRGQLAALCFGQHARASESGGPGNRTGDVLFQQTIVEAERIVDLAEERVRDLVDGNRRHAAQLRRFLPPFIARIRSGRLRSLMKPPASFWL